MPLCITPLGVRFMTVNLGGVVWRACGLGVRDLSLRDALVVCPLSLREGRPTVGFGWA